MKKLFSFLALSVIILFTFSASSIFSVNTGNEKSKQMGGEWMSFSMSYLNTTISSTTQDVTSLDVMTFGGGSEPINFTLTMTSDANLPAGLCDEFWVKIEINDSWEWEGNVENPNSSDSHSFNVYEGDEVKISYTYASLTDLGCDTQPAGNCYVSIQ